jgi:hypothetical protein
MCLLFSAYRQKDTVKYSKIKAITPHIPPGPQVSLGGER